MARKTAPHLILVSMLVLLSGCWDRTEINDIAFIVATAYDKEGEKYRVTFQLPLVKQFASPGGGSTGGEKAWYLDSSTGITIREADDRQQESTSRDLYFGHRRVLIFGEALAREDITKAIDISARMPENRLTALAVISKGPGRNILNVESIVERIPSEKIRELIVLTMTKPPTVRMMLDIIKSDGIDLMLPAVEIVQTEPGEQGKPIPTIQFSSLGVFRGNKLVGYMDEELAQGLLVGSGHVGVPNISVGPFEEGNITIRLTEINQKIRLVSTTNPYKYELVLRAKGGVIENQSRYDLSNAARLAKVEQLLNERMNRMVDKVLERLKEMKSDPLGFGDVLYRTNPKEWHEIRNNWHEDVYPHIQVDVKTNVHIEYPGSLIYPTREDTTK